MYSDKIIDIFKDAKNAGQIRGCDAIGSVGNMKCGDIMKFYLKLEKGKITDAKFKTFGCVAAIASCDVACDLIKGKTLDEALKVTNKDVLAVLGQVPAAKVHCSVMAQEAIEAAAKDYNKRQAKLADAKKKK